MVLVVGLKTLNLPVIIKAARPEIPVNEVETGDQNDHTMLDLGELCSKNHLQ